MEDSVFGGVGAFAVDHVTGEHKPEAAAVPVLLHHTVGRRAPDLQLKPKVVTATFVHYNLTKYSNLLISL